MAKQKALTKEDLMYILQSIFHLSDEPNNAFKMLNDGLYVQDYHDDLQNSNDNLQNHIDNTNVHISNIAKSILDKFSVDSNGNLYFDNKSLGMQISNENKNAIQYKTDGYYVEDITKETKEHINNNDIHVTPEIKQKLENVEDNTKKYTDDKIQDLMLYDFFEVDSLPSQEHVCPRTIYMLKNDPECPDGAEYVLYTYNDGKYKAISLTKTIIKKFFDKYLFDNKWHEHNNSEVLNNLKDGNINGLLYKNKPLLEYSLSDEPLNALRLIDNKLYAKDYTQEIKSLQLNSALHKTILCMEEITNSGKYILYDDIDNYALIIIDYYYKPLDPDEAPGCAKSITVLPETLNELYQKGIDYMIEMGYGVSTANIKFHFNKNKLYINYYNNICIYKITGVGGAS